MAMIWTKFWIATLYWMCTSEFKFARAADRCKFTVDKSEFDLCPLLQRETVRRIVTREDTPPTVTTSVYSIGLGGPLKRNATWPDQLQCPEGTWICLTVYNTRPPNQPESRRILQVVPVAGNLDENHKLSPSANLGNKPVSDDHHVALYMTLHGGRYVHKAQRALFQFRCDHNSEEPSHPTFLYKWNGTHAFSWITKQACPIALAKPEEPTDPDVDPDPPTDPPEDLDDFEDLLPPMRISNLAIAFWSILVAYIFLSVILYPRLSRGSRLHSSIQYCIPISLLARLRLPVSRFLPWVREDAVDHDTELLLNSLDYYELADGEEMPLKPSPNFEPRMNHASYGSLAVRG